MKPSGLPITLLNETSKVLNNNVKYYLSSNFHLEFSCASFGY